MAQFIDEPEDSKRALEQMGSCPRDRCNFDGFAELSLNPDKDPSWDGRPIPLAGRLIRAPAAKVTTAAVSDVPQSFSSLISQSMETWILPVSLHESLEEAIRAARSRVPTSRRGIRRPRARRLVTNLHGIDVDVIDARKVAELTLDAILRGDAQAWRRVEVARALHAQVILISTAGTGEAVLIFASALGTGVIERDTAIYDVDRKSSHREPSRQPPLEEWVKQVPLALGAALIAAPAGEALGV
jgi:hypothetical protein